MKKLPIIAGIAGAAIATVGFFLLGIILMSYAADNVERILPTYVKWKVAKVGIVLLAVLGFSIRTLAKQHWDKPLSRRMVWIYAGLGLAGFILFMFYLVPIYLFTMTSFPCDASPCPARLTSNITLLIACEILGISVLSIIRAFK